MCILVNLNLQRDDYDYNTKIKYVSIVSLIKLSFRLLIYAADHLQLNESLTALKHNFYYAGLWENPIIWGFMKAICFSHL